MTLSIFAPPASVKPAAPSDTNPIVQLRIAWQHKLAAAIGAIPGIVPIGTYQLGHHELTSWHPGEDPKALASYAGLVFSALTVVSWAANTFATGNRTETWIKALGFTGLVEALMMTSSSQVLSLTCLGLLIAINAVANGCRLAVRAAATPPTKAEKIAVRPSKTKARPRKTPVPANTSTISFPSHLTRAG